MKLYVNFSHFEEVSNLHCMLKIGILDSVAAGCGSRIVER
jgi:hypothetical protein